MIFGATNKTGKILLTIANFPIVILLAIAAYGYQPASSNIYNQLPAVMSLLNPELYAHDFYVQEMVQFTPRYYYFHLIILGMKLGFSLSHTCFFLYLAAFSSFLTGLYALGRQIGQSRISATALVFLGFAALSNGRIGFADLFRSDPLPATLAMGIAIWGIYSCFCQRWRLGYFFFGLACLIQFLVGALPGMLLAVPLVTAQKFNRLRRISLAFLILGGLACLVYLPMRLSGNTNSGILSNEEFVYLYANIRHPHHLVFSTFGFLGSRGWLNFISFTVGGLFCINSLRSLNTTVKAQLNTVIYMTFILLIINFIFVEIYPSDIVAKLQFVRATPFSQLMILLGISILVKEKYRTGDFPAVCLLLISPILKGSGALFFIVGLSLWLDNRSWQDHHRFDKIVCCWGLFSLPFIAANFQYYWLAGLAAISSMLIFTYYERWQVKHLVRKSWVQLLLLGLVFWLMILEFSIVGCLIGLMFVLWRTSRKNEMTSARWVPIATLFLFVLSIILHYHYDLLLAIAISFPLLLAKQFPTFQQQRQVYAGLLAILIIYLGALSFRGSPPTMTRFLGPRVSLGFMPDQDERAIATLGREFQAKSPPDALVLVPPQEETFRFYAQRSLVFTFKGFPFTDQGIQMWRERLETIMGIDSVLAVDDFNRDRLDTFYRDRSSADILAIAQQFGAGYILTRQDWHPDLAGTLVAQEQGWIIRQVSEDRVLADTEPIR